jgi:hypothetical protein
MWAKVATASNFQADLHKLFLYFHFCVVCQLDYDSVLVYCRSQHAIILPSISEGKWEEILQDPQLKLTYEEILEKFYASDETLEESGELSGC